MKRGLDNEECVHEVVTETVSPWMVHLNLSTQCFDRQGHTVLMSGLTLILSFMALVAFPVTFLSSVGKGSHGLSLPVAHRSAFQTCHTAVQEPRW